MLRLLLLSLLGLNLVSCKAFGDPCIDGTYSEGTLFLYTDGCYPYYYECVHGESLQRPCAPGTVFDTAVGVCNHPRDTAGCAGFCSSDGDLFIPSDGCYSFYYQCVHGSPVEKQCPAGLVFDTSSNTCNWPSAVSACIVDSAGCDGHSHGDLYLPDDGCYNYFYQCVHGTAVQMPCPAGLAFDTSTDTCNWPSEIDACPGSGSATTTKKPTTTTLAASGGCHGHSHEDLYILDDGCYNYFYQCVHGTAQKMPCAADLAFDTTQGRCNYKSEIPACNGEYDTTTTQATTTPPASSEACHGHSHGDLYIPDDGCYNYFYQCVHGTAVKMPCPASLVFDTTQQRCNYPSAVPACNGDTSEDTSSTTTTTTESTTTTAEPTTTMAPSIVGKTYVGFVVDNTGSMANEIDAVKEWMKDCIDGDKLICGNEPSGGWLVASFNDPTARLEVGPTTDISEAISVVDALKPHGGWDCPEMAFLGLKKAIDAIPDDNRGCKIFFFSDASPKDYIHLPYVLSSFLKKKCFFIPVLTSCCGVCHSPCDHVSSGFCADHVTTSTQTRRRRDTGPYDPPEDYYYDLSEKTGGNIYIANKPNTGSELLVFLEKEVTLGFCDSEEIAGPDDGYKCEADCVAMKMCWDRSVSKCFCKTSCSKSPIPSQLSRCGGSQMILCTVSTPSQVFPDDYDCGSYFECKSAYLHYRTCPKDTAFNRIQKVCDFPSNFSGSCGTKESAPEEILH